MCVHIDICTHMCVCVYAYIYYIYTNKYKACPFLSTSLLVGTLIIWIIERAF